MCAQRIQDFSEEFVLVLKVWKPWELRERERELSPNFADLVSGLGIGNLNSQETLLRYNLNLKTFAVRSSRGLRTFNSSLL